MFCFGAEAYAERYGAGATRAVTLTAALALFGCPVASMSHRLMNGVVPPAVICVSAFAVPLVRRARLNRQ